MVNSNSNEMNNLHYRISRLVHHWFLERKRQAEQNIVTFKPVITLSRQRGCRGQELSRLLAYELEYYLLDRDMIHYAAKHIGPRCEIVESLDSQMREELERALQNRFAEAVTPSYDFFYGVCETVWSVALQGSVVILGRGANFLLETFPGLRVRLVAPIDYRVRSLIDYEEYSETEARIEIEREDRLREAFVLQYYDQNIHDPLHYDLVLNMGSLHLDTAVQAIVNTL